MDDPWEPVGDVLDPGIQFLSSDPLLGETKAVVSCDPTRKFRYTDLFYTSYAGEVGGGGNFFKDCYG